MKRGVWKKLSALLLSVFMILCMIPTMVFAEGETEEHVFNYKFTNLDDSFVQQYFELTTPNNGSAETGYIISNEGNGSYFRVYIEGYYGKYTQSGLDESQALYKSVPELEIKDIIINGKSYGSFKDAPDEEPCEIAVEGVTESDMTWSDYPVHVTRWGDSFEFEFNYVLSTTDIDVEIVFAGTPAAGAHKFHVTYENEDGSAVDQEALGAFLSGSLADGTEIEADESYAWRLDNYYYEGSQDNFGNVTKNFENALLKTHPEYEIKQILVNNVDVTAYMYSAEAAAGMDIGVNEVDTAIPGLEGIDGELPLKLCCTLGSFRLNFSDFTASDDVNIKIVFAGAPEDPAGEVAEQIADLPVAGDLTLEDKEAVEAAKAAYDALTDEEKEAIDPLLKTELDLAVATIENLESQNTIADLEQQLEEALAELEAAKEQLAKTPGWHKNDDESWYFCDNKGETVKGWLSDGGKWYFMDKETGIMQTGWVKDGSTWYYMSGSGAMVTGWQKVGDTWYFFKSSGAMAANEWCEGYWLNANGSWTYQPKGSWKKNNQGWWFGDTSGWYAKNTTQKIDGTNYKFNAAGYWVQ